MLNLPHFGSKTESIWGEPIFPRREFAFEALALKASGKEEEDAV